VTDQNSANYKLTSSPSLSLFNPPSPLLLNMTKSTSPKAQRTKAAAKPRKASDEKTVKMNKSAKAKAAKPAPENEADMADFTMQENGIIFNRRTDGESFKSIALLLETSATSVREQFGYLSWKARQETRKYKQATPSQPASSSSAAASPPVVA
jgi:hypothetical protein